MTINPVSVKINKKQNNNLPEKQVYFGNTHYNQQNVSVPKDKVSFGSSSKSIGDLATGVFKFIDNSSFFVEFLIVDTISLILPRIWIGLNRDKEKLGHYNYKAGAEEAGRECLSGPSMNLIPMGILAAVCAAIPASRMDRKTLHGLTHNLKQIVNDGTQQSVAGKSDELSKKLAGKIFDDTFGTKFAGKEKDALRAEFSDLLIESTKNKPKSWFATKILKQNDTFKTASDDFTNLVNKLNNRAAEAPTNPKQLEISLKDVTENGAKKNKTTKVSASNLFEDFRNYHRDVISKLTKNKYTESAADFLKTLKNNRLALKTLTAFSAFMAVGAFLLYIPKLYQLGKTSPALESAERAGENETGGAK